ncbi:MAG: hypothetical protein RL420_1714, partial [Pseudomonadota bacterium]
REKDLTGNFIMEGLLVLSEKARLILILK